MAKITALALVLLSLGACTASEMETWGEILDALEVPPETSIEAKKACFDPTGANTDACEERYDRTFSTGE